MPKFHTTDRRDLLSPPRRLQIHSVWSGGYGLRAELSRGDNMAGERQEVRVALRWPWRIPLPIGGTAELISMCLCVALMNKQLLFC